eukprot:TRINITY_DN111627_c0_g1_i1.p3 TRINITY_DN111627_c0_g1~~TRINITY_DN111627_c0_g1_i1.p3  ORF type:complete len:100 (-),score=1.93 TRINITY_DN111627_c0_g1_i1:53-352(-)
MVNSSCRVSFLFQYMFVMGGQVVKFYQQKVSDLLAFVQFACLFLEIYIFMFGSVEMVQIVFLIKVIAIVKNLCSLIQDFCLTITVVVLLDGGKGFLCCK